ncbi:MAG: chaperone modulator CbpM [Bacteroidia bacterium]|nr:chaperone modulator CbpM [Bacteroidia bacterium]
MSNEHYIPVKLVCHHYQIEMAFVTHLVELGLVEITQIEDDRFLHHDALCDLEKMIRLHHELHINPEGIDVVFNLLEKIDSLQNELTAAQNRLRRFDSF